jgi:lipopolysaccharide export system permease protein
MKHSTRLIFGSVVPMVLLSWAALIAITLLMTSKDEFSRLGINNYSIANALNYLMLTTPRRAYEYFVYSGAIGFVIGLGQLAQSSELIAMQSLGVSRQGIVLRALAALALITFMVMAGAEWWGSYGDRRAAAVAAQAQGTGVSLSGETGLWIKDGGSFINARTVVLDRDGQPSALWNIRIFQFAEQTKDQGESLSRLLSVKSAHYLGARGWQLNDVLDQRFDSGGARQSHIDSLIWPSRLQPEQISARAMQAQRLNILELYRNVTFARENKLDDRVFVSSIWHRIAFPFTVLSLALAAAPFVFGSLRSGGLGRSIFLGLIVAVGFFMVERLVSGVFDTYRWNYAIGNLLPPCLLAIWGWWRLGRQT